MLRSHADILRALHELGAGLDPDGEQPTQPVRTPLSAPQNRASARTGADVSGVTPTGDAISVAIAGARHPTLLAFLTSGCTTCADFWSAFSDTDALTVPGDARLVVVTKGEDGESAARLRKFTPPDVPVVMSSEAWTAYDVPVAPYFAYVEAESGSIVGEGAAMSWSQLAGMMDQALDEAGISRSGDGRRRRSQGETRQARDQRAERALRTAGIEPGDPSLYPRTAEDLHDHGSR